jgi:hypothetical protein
LRHTPVTLKNKKPQQTAIKRWRQPLLFVVVFCVMIIFLIITTHLMKTFLLIVAISTSLTGCTRNARLYPANDLAIAGGVLVANFKSYGSGNGEIEIGMPDGEILSGEYSLVRGGSASFGSLYGSVYSTEGSATVSGSANSRTIPGGSQGMASLFGNKGTAMECEFINDNFSGHGNGACKTSTKAMYRLQF